MVLRFSTLEHYSASLQSRKPHMYTSRRPCESIHHWILVRRVAFSTDQLTPCLLHAGTQTPDDIPNDQSRDSITDGSSAEQNTIRSLPPAYANLTETWNKHTESAVTKQGPCKVQAVDMLSVGDQDLEDCLEAFKAGLANSKDGQADLDDVFMQHLPSTPLLWRYYAATLQHVCHRGYNPDPVLRCLLQDDGHLLRKTSPFENVSHCAEFTERLGVIAQTDYVHVIFEMLALMAVDADNSATEAHDLIILRLIEHTSRHESLSLARKRSHALASKLQPSTDNKLLLSHFPYGKNVQHVILSTVRRVAEASCDFASAERALIYMPRQQLLGLVPKITSSFVNLRKDGSMGTCEFVRKPAPFGRRTRSRRLATIASSS
jgi:hypothetical protein